MLAVQWPSPLFAAARLPALVTLVALPLILIAIEFLIWRRSARALAATFPCAAVALIALAALAATTVNEARSWGMRQQVLQADPSRLEKLGRHFMVGYHDDSELRRLVELRAIAGVFVTAHNVQGKTAATKIGRASCRERGRSGEDTERWYTRDMSGN